jgi:tol-pal system protein YbgF
MSAQRTFKNTRKARIFLGLLAMVTLADAGLSTVYAQQDDRARIKRLENEVETLSRALYKGETPPPGAFSGGSDDAAGLSVRLDQLETLIRDLNGKLEEQTFMINQLKSDLGRMSGDVEMRLNNVSGNTGGSSGGSRYTAGGYNASPANDMPPVPQPSYGSNANATEAPYPQDRGADTGGPQGGQYQWSSNNGMAGGEPSLGTLGSSPSQNDAGAMSYENAFSLLKAGQYDAAEQGFQEFISQNPNHTLIPNAKYWLGESYYARGQYDKASRTFAEAYQKYPKSAKAPDNLLKLGLSLAGLGKKDDACIALGQIEKEFAASAGPVLRRAKQEMTHFGC